VILLVIACSASTPQRTVTDKTIYSNFPKLSIHINPEFEYMGVEQKNVFGPNRPQVKREIHKFTCPGKFVYVEFNILGPDNWFRYPSRFTDKERFFIIDREKILKRDVPYAIEYDNQYSCLRKHVVRDFGRGGYVHLIYSEKAPYFLGACSFNEQLTPEQQAAVEAFLSNYKTDITFSK
jgi:hypothetical protein